MDQEFAITWLARHLSWTLGAYRSWTVNKVTRIVLFRPTSKVILFDQMTLLEGLRTPLSRGRAPVCVVERVWWKK